MVHLKQFNLHAFLKMSDLCAEEKLTHLVCMNNLINMKKTKQKKKTFGHFDHACD